MTKVHLLGANKSYFIHNIAVLAVAFQYYFLID